jgi:L-arabinokinase
LPAVFFYVSGHGFGHASRQIEIINSLGRLRPDLTIVVRSSAARWLFDRTARVPVNLLPGDCDTGVVQVDSLHLDERRTIARAAEFHRTIAARAAQEAALLRAQDAVLVVADAPPLGSVAAAAAGVPSVVVGNFTWDWIYEAYAGELASEPDLLPTIRDAYRLADEAWRLPMHGGFASCRTIADMPFVARHAIHTREDVRRLLSLPLDRTLVLSSFGGYGVNDLDVRQLDCLRDHGVVVTHRDVRDTARDVPAGVHQITEGALYGSGLRYEDLVAACDVVATKPGYGIIAECVANQTAIMYTSRGRFAEYEVLVGEMPRYVRCGFIDHDALFAGRWRDVLTRILAAGDPPERPPTDGARRIAELIASRV